MKTALVLQGGGARGIFTTGVLDALLESNIKIDKVFAVSAGGLNAMNYISKQKGRARVATVLTFKSREFKSLHNVVTKRTFVDFSYYFGKLNETLPFDNVTYDTNPCELCVVATSLRTGKAHYFNKSVDRNFDDCIKASASIPLVAKMVPIYDDEFLDGGDSDPVPYKKAIEEGYDRVIVVVTRPMDFRKKPTQDKRVMRLYNLAYKSFPNYLKALKNSHTNYNQEFNDLSGYMGKIFIISPSEQINLKHLETDTKKLDYYYNLGYKIFNEKQKDLIKYLK